MGDKVEVIAYCTSYSCCKNKARVVAEHTNGKCNQCGHVVIITKNGTFRRNPASQSKNVSRTHKKKAITVYQGE